MMQLPGLLHDAEELAAEEWGDAFPCLELAIQLYGAEGEEGGEGFFYYKVTHGIPDDAAFGYLAADDARQEYPHGIVLLLLKRVALCCCGLRLLPCLLLHLLQGGCYTAVDMRQCEQPDAANPCRLFFCLGISRTVGAGSIAVALHMADEFLVGGFVVIASVPLLRERLADSGFHGDNI